MWRWFHRVLLGTLIESFRDHGIAVDASTFELGFDDRSEFHFPAFDNRLRFLGQATGQLVRPVPDATLDALRVALADAWPSLVDELRRFPVPDRLSVTRNQVSVDVDGDRIVVTFALEAD